MNGKIALEEHFAIDETLNDSAGFLGDEVWPELSGRLMDIHEKRLRLMDAHGIEVMILSLNAPAVQAIPDPARAGDIARRANDFLAEQECRFQSHHIDQRSHSFNARLRNFVFTHTIAGKSRHSSSEKLQRRRAPIKLE